MSQFSLAHGLTELRAAVALMLLPMPDVAARVPRTDAVVSYVQNGDVSWNTFSSDAYWQHNYRQLQPEDQEILNRVSQFFARAFADRAPARRGVDVGSGTNLYPALLMLPWTDQILLTDYSANNVGWLRKHVDDDGDAWSWLRFWRELQNTEGYDRIGAPREKLRKACADEPGYAGIEQRSVFELPTAQWDLGTMFFVAESITEDPGEFRAALARFAGALKPGSPFAAAFMAGSNGYPVADTQFPALPITPDDVQRHFTELGVSDLSVELLQTEHRVRDGYAGMIVATGVVRNS